ncbi:MAG: single-stranded DNA-binding protein [Patescibacteria group bacterium]
MASRSWNRVELIGNLTRDPELRYTPNGAAVCTFSIATNRTYISEGEKKEEVDFHRLVSWNKLAELCNQLLKKGNRVFVSGRLQNRSWEGADGQTRNVTEIVVEDMIVLTPKATNEEPVIPAVEELGGGVSAIPVQSPPDDDTSSKKVQPKKTDEEKEEEPPKKESSKKEEVDESDLPF